MKLIMESWKSFINEKVDHDEILDKAEGSAKSGDDVPRLETLHQNIAHMTIALKELETRRLRVANKHKSDGKFLKKALEGLDEEIETIKKNIEETEKQIEEMSK